MKIFLSKSTRILIKATRKELRRRRKQSLDDRGLANFADALKCHQLLCPQFSAYEYQKAVQEICACGLAKYYTRGGFEISPRGLDVIEHPVKSAIIANRAEIISLISLSISATSLAISMFGTPGQ